MSGKLVAGALLVVLWMPAGSGDRPITVSAALSLNDVLEDLVAAYSGSGGGPVRVNMAASNVLARQIVSGAPVDVFISADTAQMAVVEKSGLVAVGSRTDIVGNRLALAALRERVEAVRHAFPHAGPEIRRLAVADPAAVPAGVYARTYLEQRGLWSAYEARVIPTANVRAALVAVENGSADAAIVFATDVAHARRTAVALIVPVEEGPHIVYPGAVIATTSNRQAADRFLAYLRGPDAAAIFARHGFVPLGAASRQGSQP